MTTVIADDTASPFTFEQEVQLWRGWVVSRPRRDPLRKWGERRLKSVGLPVPRVCARVRKKSAVVPAAGLTSEPTSEGLSRPERPARRTSRRKAVGTLGGV